MVSHLERWGEVGELSRTEEGWGGEGETPLGRHKYETEKMDTFDRTGKDPKAQKDPLYSHIWEGRRHRRGTSKET